MSSIGLKNRLNKLKSQIDELDPKDYTLIIEIDENGGYKEIEYKGKKLKFSNEDELDTFIEKRKLFRHEDITVLIDDVPWED